MSLPSFVYWETLPKSDPHDFQHFITTLRDRNINSCTSNFFKFTLFTHNFKHFVTTLRDRNIKSCTSNFFKFTLLAKQPLYHHWSIFILIVSRRLYPFQQSINNNEYYSNLFSIISDHFNRMY